MQAQIQQKELDKEFDELKLSGDEAGSEENLDDVDLEDLEKELNEMDDDTETTEKKPVIKAKPLKQREEQYHGLPFLFGNTLEIELSKVIPALQKKYQGEEHFDFIQALNKKEADIYKFKIALNKKVKEGAIDEKKYLDILGKILGKNKEVLDGDELIEEDRSRVGERVRLLNEEIKMVKEAIENAGEEEEEEEEDNEVAEETNKEEEPAPVNKEAPAPVNKEEQASIDKEELSPQVSEELIQKQEEPEPAQETTAEVQELLTRKIDDLAQIRAFLSKNLFQERRETIREIDSLLTELKTTKRDIKFDKQQLTIEQINQTFPDRLEEFVIGTTREERDAEIAELMQKIKEQIQSESDNKIKKVYMENYTPLLRSLKRVKESRFGILPKIKPNSTAIEYKELNDDLDDGEFEITIRQLDLEGIDRSFYVGVEFSYENEDYTFLTDYCKGDGSFNHVKRYNLAKRRIFRSFTRQKIRLCLYKKRMLFFSRFVSEAHYSIQKLTNFNILNQVVEFDYKDGKKIKCEVEVRIKAALSKGMKEIKFETVTKEYPIYGANAEVKEETQSERRVTKQVVDEKKFQSEPTQKKQVVSKYKFPLVSPQQKASIKAIIAKNKLPSSYNDFQENIFSITFLEQFVAELEKQMSDEAMFSNFKMMKEVQDLYLKMSKFMNYMVKSIESGEMSTLDYKEKLESFVKLDELQLKFFEQIKLEQAQIFIKNRMEITKGELGQLEAILAEGEED